FVGMAFQLTDAALDGPLDVFIGNVGRSCLVDGQAQSKVGVGIRSALASGDGDQPGHFRKDFAATSVLLRLLMFDIGPFGVASHPTAPSSSCQTLGIAPII